MVKVLDFSTEDLGFDFWPGLGYCTLGHGTYVPLFTKQYKCLPAIVG